MVSEESTRKVVKSLRAAGWTPGKTVGRHTKWHARDGRTLTVPDGHRRISPGVMRQIMKAIEETE